MPASSTTLHEAPEHLTEHTINMHRAIVSLIEELEAIDWYSQRAEACSDANLRAIIRHNMEEEIEHATMTLEWIRRHFPKFDETLHTYLFTTGDIVAIEKKEESGSKAGVKEDRSSSRTTIGDMKGS